MRHIHHTGGISARWLPAPIDFWKSHWVNLYAKSQHRTYEEKTERMKIEYKKDDDHHA